MTVDDVFDRVFDEIAGSAWDLPGSMAHVVEHAGSEIPPKTLGVMQSADFAREQAGFVAWASRLLRTEPPGPEIDALWMGMFEAARGWPRKKSIPQPYLAGSDCFDADDETFDWAASAVYWPDGLYPSLPALTAVARSIGSRWEHRYALAWLLGKVYGLGLGRALVHEVPTELLLVNRPRGRHIAVGHDDGDVWLYGEITPSGFRALPIPVPEEPPLP